MCFQSHDAEVTLDCTLGLLFLDKHTLGVFWSWIPQRRALRTGGRQQLEQPEYLPECAPAQTGSFVCRPTKETQP